MNNGALFLGRLLMALIFVMAGIAKLATPAAAQAMIVKYGLPVPMLAYLVTVVVEVGGGVLLLIGLLTRPAAIVLALWCIATAVVAHANFADPAQAANFMKNVAMAGGFLYVWVAGAGAWSIDAWLKRRKA